MSMRQKVLLILTILILIFTCYSGLKFYKSAFTNHHSKNYLNNIKVKLQNGDIIFQTSKSKQSKAIQLATKSKYTHVGIIYKKGKDFYVFEAAQKVKLTPLNSWINRGVNGHFMVKRLINANEILTDKNILKMKKIGKKFLNKITIYILIGQIKRFIVLN